VRSNNFVCYNTALKEMFICTHDLRAQEVLTDDQQEHNASYIVAASFGAGAASKTRVCV
jgi:hypothetical protein